MTTGEVLIAAAGLVQRGWVQGKMSEEPLFGHSRRFCLVGAVQEVTRYNDHEWDSCNRWLLRALGVNLQTQPAWSHCLMAWNDERGRRRDEVVELLLQAAALWRRAQMPRAIPHPALVMVPVPLVAPFGIPREIIAPPTAVFTLRDPIVDRDREVQQGDQDQGQNKHKRERVLVGV